MSAILCKKHCCNRLQKGPLSYNLTSSHSVRPISPNMNLRPFQSNFESPPENNYCQSNGQLMPYASNVTNLPTYQNQRVQTDNFYSAVPSVPSSPYIPYMPYANNVTYMPTDQNHFYQNQLGLRTNNFYSAQIYRPPQEPKIFRPWQNKAEKSPPTTVANDISLGNNINMPVDWNHRHNVIDPPKQHAVGLSTPNTKHLDITNNNEKTPTTQASNSFNNNITTPVDWSVRPANFTTATSRPSEIIDQQESKSSDHLSHPNNNYIVAEGENQNDSRNINSFNNNSSTPADWSVQPAKLLKASRPSEIINRKEGKSTDQLSHPNNNNIVADSWNLDEASRSTTYSHKRQRKSKRSFTTAEKLNAIHRVKVKYGEKASKVCKDLGINEVNFCRWLQNPELMMLYEKQRNGFKPNYSNDSFNVTDTTSSNESLSDVSIINNFDNIDATFGKENYSTNTTEASTLRLPAKPILHRKFSRTAKLYAIHQVKSGEPQISLCRRLGLDASTLCRWLQNADLLKLYAENRDPSLISMTSEELLRFETQIVVIKPRVGNS